MHYFQNFDKIDSCLKNVPNVLQSKKDYNFEQPFHSHKIVLMHTYNTADAQNTLIIFCQEFQ